MISLDALRNFSLWYWKSIGTRVAGEYCWAITGVGAVMPRSCRGRSRSSVLEFGLQLDCLECTLVYSYIYVCVGGGLDGPGIESQEGKDFPHPSRPARGPPILRQCVPGLFSGCKTAMAWRWPPTHLLPSFKKECGYLYYLLMSTPTLIANYLIELNVCKF